MARDTIITRKQPKMSRLRLAKNEATERRAISGFSRQSRSRAIRHLRNSTCYRTFAVLTFPDEVRDDRMVKNALDRFARRMARLGASFFWKQEFYRTGRPHLHVLLTRELDEGTVGQLWASSLGVLSVHVYCEPIRTFEGATNYLMKTCDHWQHAIPEGYRNMGRFWGTRGPKANPDTLFRARGDASTLAALVRPLRRLEKTETGKRGRKPKRDNGIAGRTFYDCGGQAVAEALKTLALDVEKRAEMADPPAAPPGTPPVIGTDRPAQFLLLAGFWVLAKPADPESISAGIRAVRSGA